MSEQELRRSRTIDIEASPTTVYDTVRQLERMGEWSSENLGGRWVEGDGTSVGDRFEGDNRIGEREWSVEVIINAAEPGVMFAFHSGPSERPRTQWTYQMEPNESGTALTETWELLDPEPLIASRGPDYPAQRADMIETNLLTTLTNLKASIESDG